MNNKCAVCSKVVYEMEKIQALGRIWHKLCFRCAATAPEEGKDKEVRCGKKLTLTDYSERKNPEGGDSIPYCKTCYNKV